MVGACTRYRGAQATVAKMAIRIFSCGSTNTRDRSSAIERAVAFPTTGKNPATHAVFSSDAMEGEQGRIWWVMGGRAHLQPLDLVRSLDPFSPLAFEVVLDNFVTEPHSTTPALAVVGETGLLAYRWRSSGSKSGEIRFRDYYLPGSSPPQLRSEKSLGRASNHSSFGHITIEQLWSRWDPRYRRFALTWLWYAHAVRPAMPWARIHSYIPMTKALPGGLRMARRCPCRLRIQMQ